MSKVMLYTHKDNCNQISGFIYFLLHVTHIYIYTILIIKTIPTNYKTSTYSTHIATLFQEG